jgi:hypothetical protein
VTENKKVSVKLGCSPLLFLAAALILMILKLTAYPAISWWTVVAVAIFPILLSIVFMGMVFSVVILVALFGKR